MIRAGFDVVVAGGGVAGASVAAALGEFGYAVLVAEPGLDSGKRLAGELIHPPGASDLAELGLLKALERAGGVPVRGFAVWPDASAPAWAAGEARGRPAPRAACLLPYAEVPGLQSHGVALDHAALTAGLLGAVAQLPHVSVWLGARVTRVDLAPTDGVTVTLSRGRQTVQLRARLLVAADGGNSHIRRMAGIGRLRSRLSTLVGLVVAGRLPHDGFAHVFVGGPAPALAYHLGPDAVRVMFDIPKAAGALGAARVEAGSLDALPEPFGTAVRRVLASRTPLVSASYSVVPEAVVKERLVLVGDAAGCCHPLTATGLSVCTRDAIRLRRALRETGGDIPAALRRYARLREGPQRTRAALAGALYAAFTAQTPAMRTLRQGLLRYWQRSRHGRAASMALLSTHEDRMAVMAIEYVRVVGHALVELARRDGAPDPSLRARGRALLELSRSMLGYAAAALRAACSFRR